MLTKQELFVELDKDNKIDKTDLEGEIINCPVLMTKYLRYHYDYSKKIIDGETYLNKKMIERRKFYSGHAEAADYKREPFNDVIKNQKEMDSYLAADSQLASINDAIEEIKLLRQYCSDMIDQLKYRPNHLSTIQDIRQFQSGA